jgi:hypothetical protein
MTPLFKEDHLECYLDEDAKILFHVWLKKPTSEQLRSGLTRVFDEYNKHKKSFNYPLNWLGDTRKLCVVTLDDQGWLEKVWNEMLFVKAAVKAHAVVIGDDVFAKYAMEKFKNAMQTKYADKNLHMETFKTTEEAYTWFKNIEKRIAPPSA